MNWHELQERDLNFFLENGANGLFSHDDFRPAHFFRDVLNHYASGTCLDIGCGLLPLPTYMRATKLKWFGIEPLNYQVERKFTAVQGRAEELPFKNDHFDNVTFATSFDHVEDPRKSADEAYRVLKPGGLCFVWNTIYQPDDHYFKWKAEGGLFDNLHNWGFTTEDIYLLFSKFVKEKEIKVTDTEYIFILRK